MVPAGKGVLSFPCSAWEGARWGHGAGFGTNGLCVGLSPSPSSRANSSSGDQPLPVLSWSRSKNNESVLIHISPSLEKQRFCTVITPSSALGTEALLFWHLEAPRGLPGLGKMDKNCANPMN